MLTLILKHTFFASESRLLNKECAVSLYKNVTLLLSSSSMLYVALLSTMHMANYDLACQDPSNFHLCT